MDDEDDGGGGDDEACRRRCRCLANSSILWEEQDDDGAMVGVEAFAMAYDDYGGRDEDDDHVDEAAGHSTSGAMPSSTTVAAAAAAAVAVEVGDIAATDRRKSSALEAAIIATATTTTTTGRATDEDGGGGDVANGGGGGAAASKYRVVVRETAATHRAGGAGAVLDVIPLDSRPTSVHVAELHVDVDDDEDDGDGDGDEITLTGTTTRRSEDPPPSSPTTAVGIFVASADDGAPLRLYVATRGALRAGGGRRRAGSGGVTGGRDDDGGGPCFALASLDDAGIARARGRDADGVGGNDDDGKTREPLTFATPIVAMDTIVTDEWPSRATDGKGGGGRARLNRLAISCYDGTVRILTYRLAWRRGGRNADAEVTTRDDRHRRRESPPPRLKILRYSSFVVDGPVVSLHFGTTATTTITPVGISPAEDGHRPPSLFLVVGSLCGFACLFYESPRPSTFSPHGGGGSPVAFVVGGVDRHFDGPVTVVDGLYDARRGGREDCVTSVHVRRFCHRAEVGRERIIIAVGTHGGRVLLFRQCEEGGTALAQIRDEIAAARREMEELALRIDRSKEQMAVLLDEKDEMGIKARDLDVVIAEMHGKIDSTTGIDEVKESDLADNREFKLGNVAFPYESPLNVVDEEGRERTYGNNDSGLNAPLSLEAISDLETDLIYAQSELSSLQRSMYGHSCKIAELSSAVDDLERDLGERGEAIARRQDDLQHPRVLRKLHRYEISCECHLPYPIHGIASSAFRDDDGGGLDIFVSTRRSFHVFRHHHAFDGVAALAERGIT
jgi:hypothetical protein